MSAEYEAEVRRKFPVPVPGFREIVLLEAIELGTQVYDRRTIEAKTFLKWHPVTNELLYSHRIGAIGVSHAWYVLPE